MDTLTALTVLAQGAFSVAQFVLPILAPGISAVALPAVGLLLHRSIKNQQTADMIESAAGFAYNQIATTLSAAGGHLDLQAVRSEAVSLASSAISGLVKSKTGLTVSSDELKTLVDGGLGKLLALDPNFSVTGPVNQLLHGVTSLSGSAIGDVQSMFGNLGSQSALQDVAAQLVPVTTQLGQTVNAGAAAVGSAAKATETAVEGVASAIPLVGRFL